VRGIANLVLDTASEERIPVSNLSINKIIYFLHVAYLYKFQKPLVSAKIEAWEHGPVFREIYHQFKIYGRNPVSERARKLDPASGAYIYVGYCFDSSEEFFLKERCSELLKISASKLVDMSHVEDGAWYKARYGEGGLNPGVEITNELILASRSEKMRH
jgi:uncharacterized phage-associated protein